MATICLLAVVDIILYKYTVLYRHVVDINSISSLNPWLYNEEKAQAAMVLEWIHRQVPTFDKELKD